MRYDRVVAIHYPFTISGENYESIVRCTIIQQDENIDYANFCFIYPKGTPDYAKEALENQDDDKLVELLLALLEEYERLQELEESLASGYNEEEPVQLMNRDIIL